jgi:pimeloyl-ACP methyl ester carboxylesterase
MEEQTIRISRGQTTLVATVYGTGPEILLLPSLGRGSEDFKEIAPKIADAGFRVVCPDPRSSGPEDLTLYDLASDAAAFLADAEPVLVAGHAFGNWVARALCFIRPGQVKGLAVLAGSLGSTFSPEVRAAIDGSFNPALSEEERLGHLERGYFAPGNDATVWLDGFDPAITALQNAAAKRTDDRWRTSSHHIPTIYVAAESDWIAPVPSSEELKKVLGDQTEMVVVKDAGHAL